jgi:uncharacterized heparinase superfamily protein
MTKKLARLYQTIRFLKPAQVFYQVHARVKSPLITSISYSKYVGTQLTRLKGICSELIPSTGKLIGINHFQFLNLEKQFEDGIDWKFSNYGKLWNYNLQYFDYLHDTGFSNDIKEKILDDFSFKLLRGEIKLEPYPVSIRIINWIIYFSHTGCSSSTFIKAIQYQVHYLSCNLEHHILANHLLENIISLLIASIATNDAALEERMNVLLVSQLNKQVLADGAHYEGSPMYHCIILSKLMLLLSVYRHHRANAPLIPTLQNVVQRMLGWLQSFCFANGTYPHLNDSAPGVAISPHVLFNYATSLNIDHSPVQLNECGYRKYSTKVYEVLVDVAAVSPRYQPGHAHADMLHFCLQHRNNPVLIDTGTSTYQAGKVREYERSTAAHNTVVVNGKNQSDTWSSFRVGSRAVVNINDEGTDFISATCTSHFSTYHQRRFLFEEGRIVISDQVSGSVKSATAYFHFHHSISNIQLNFDKVFVGGDVVITFENTTGIFIETNRRAVEFNRTVMGYTVKVNFLSILTTKINLP